MNKSLSVAIRAFALALIGGAVAPAHADPEPYLRVSERDEGNIVELDVAARAFEPDSGEGPRILLVGAAHVGDTAFYRRLQYLLDAQDVVLYEGVGLGDPHVPLPDVDDAAIEARTEHRARLLAAAAVGHKARHGSYPRSLDEMFDAMDPDTAEMLRPIAVDAHGHVFDYQIETAGRRGAEPEVVSFSVRSGDVEVGPSDLGATRVGGVDSMAGEDGIQRVLARTLGVKFQLDALDYSQPHWVNCDVTMDEFEGMLADAGLTAEGDSLLQMMSSGGLMGALQGPILGMLSGNTSLREMVKLILIDTLGRAEGMMATMPGPMGDLMGVLLHDRNEVVIDRLRDVLDDPGDYDSIAVFYGAAHLTGIEDALVHDMGYHPVATHWLAGLGVDIKRAGINPGEARAMRAMISDMMDQELRRMGADGGGSGASPRPDSPGRRSGSGGKRAPALAP